MNGQSAVHFQTLAVTSGRPSPEPDDTLSAATVVPTHFHGAQDLDAAMGYGRYGKPTWQALESAIGLLEGGAALAYASGLAAAHAALDLLPEDGTIVIGEDCYLGVLSAVAERSQKYGASVRRVELSDTASVIDACQGADMLWIESPTTPKLDVADLPAIGAALPRKVTFVADNTFATPLVQRPLEVGAHVVLHSATRSLSGHPDGLMGLLVCREENAMHQRLSATRLELGAIPGAVEAYLVLRGLRTLAVRLRQSHENAQQLAERLAAHTAIRRVRYPGLPTDPAHELAGRTMAGYGTVIAIELSNAESADDLIDSLQIWTAATTLGGLESLFERRRRWPSELTGIPSGLLRMSVGIEHVDDLWDDLGQALDRLS